MILTITDKLNTLFQTGVRRRTGEALRSRIILSNQLSVLLFPAVTVIVVTIAMEGIAPTFYDCLYLTPLFLSALTVWLNKIDKNVLARCVLCLNVSTIAWAIRTLIGHDGAGHYVFHPIIAGLPLLMFLDNESMPAVTCTAVGFTADLGSRGLTPREPVEYLKQSGFNGVAAEVVTVVIVYVLLIHIARRSAKLRETVRKVVDMQSDKLLYQSKLVEYGRAIGSVCHALSSPLSIIIGKAGNMRSQLCADHSLGYAYAIKASGEIEDAAIDLSEIVQACEQLAHDPVDGYGTVSIGNMFNSLEKLFRDSCKKSGVQIQFHAQEESMFVDCSYNDLSQVLITLINNAKDAVSSLTVKWVKVEARSKDGSIEFSVSDSGSVVKTPLSALISQQFLSNEAPGRRISTGVQDAELIVLERSGTFRKDCNKKRARFVFTFKSAEPYGALGQLIAKSFGPEFT